MFGVLLDQRTLAFVNRGLFVGFESLLKNNLDDARKKSPHPDDYARRVDIFHENGIQVNGSFVLGFDHDTPETFEQTIQWIQEKFKRG